VIYTICRSLHGITTAPYAFARSAVGLTCEAFHTVPDHAAVLKVIDARVAAWLLLVDPARMKISARNFLKGRITQLVHGAVNCEVTLEIAPGLEIVSIITKSSVESLGLEVGGDAYAVIKASSVMVAVE
jgi:molybdopterin-binding protein